MSVAWMSRVGSTQGVGQETLTWSRLCRIPQLGVDTAQPWISKGRLTTKYVYVHSSLFLTSSYLTSSLPLLRLFPHTIVQNQERIKIRRKDDQGQRLRGPVYGVSGPSEEAWGSRICDKILLKLSYSGTVPEYMTGYRWHQCGSITVGTVIWGHMQLWRKRRHRWAGQQELEPAHREVSWAGKSQSCTWVGRTGKVGESG